MSPMKKYKKVFSSFHAIYRLISSFNKIEDFVVGISKLYSNYFKSDTVVLVCKHFNSTKLLKVKIEDKKRFIRKGGVSILTAREKEILNEDREIKSEHRLISHFIFTESLGAVYIKRKKIVFSDMEKSWFAALSEQISVSLRIVSLYIEQKRTMIGYIKTLSELLNEHVPTSYIHYKNLSKLIKALGKSMRLSEMEIKSLEFASILHDAGKLNLPQKILKKEEPLTEDEFRIIMKHPKKGVALIKDLKILSPVIPIILHHHERYDGKGYPSRLKKEEIPLASRILAVLDAFDAMFFGRPYKKKMTLEEVERELKKQMYLQFDPKVVENFLKLLKKKSIRKHLNSLQ